MLKSLLIASSLFLFGSSAIGAEIDFSTRPSYLPNNAVALTFDDGPDWVNTEKVLNILRDKNVKATFFINSENWSSLTNDEPMKALVRRMFNEGHEIGNHTMRHDHLGSLSSADVEYHISHVENAVKNIFGGGGPRLTLLRAPHGEPFQLNNPAAPSADHQRIAPIVAKHGVHVGWAVDSFDYNCAVGDGNCVYNNVVNAVKVPGQGAYGQILMHSVHAQTVNALPGMIDYLRAKGFQFWSTESMVRARFGKGSAELIEGAPSNPTPPTLPAGLSEGAVYDLVARHSGKCVDVAQGGNSANGTDILQWDCRQSQNQQFRLEKSAGGYRLVNVQTNKCINVTGAGNGADINQWDCTGGNNQAFQFLNGANGSYKLKYLNSGRCMDVAGVSAASGANIHQWDCIAGQANQDFQFRKAGVTLPQVGGVYELIARHSQKCLDLDAGNPANGAKIHQWGCWGSANQKFRLENAANGALRLVNTQTNKCVDVANASTQNGGKLHQWDCVGVANQAFRLVPSVNGTFKLKFEHSGKCADVAGVSAADGALINQWECLNNQANQDFIFRAN